MGLAAPPSCARYCTPKRSKYGPNPAETSMSQGFHQGIFSFSDGFEQQQQQHIAQQSRRDRLRVQGFDPSGNLLVPVEEGVEERRGMYNHQASGNMLSEMFDFPAPGTTSSDLLATQISQAARPAAVAGISSEWYGENHHNQRHDLMQGLSADSAAAMHPFLRNPPSQIQNAASSPQAFHAASFGGGAFSGGVVGEGQGLSLSLSSSLQPFQMAKAEEMRIRSDEDLYFSSNNQQRLQVHGQEYGGVMGSANVLRNSRYARVAQELLEEFCSVGRGQLMGGRSRRLRGSSNPNPSSSGGGGASSSAAVQSFSKELPTLSSAERFEHQRKKTKLLSILDELDRRYDHYCSQMQMVVNSFDSAMGFGAATPYTSMAQKAMSRHFRCRKDAIVSQLKQTSQLLGDKDGAGGSGITKGETPRLRLLDQRLRQQRAFHPVGMMEQEAWRPQRGLPERSVTVLRAWLFEHFLHPYPSDGDKHLLARQTGLSKNQVSNWFINARVRLWKPMVEDMYQQESKEERVLEEEGSHQRVHSPTQQQVHGSSKTNAPESDLSQTHHRFTSNNPPPPPSVAVQLQAGSIVMPELCVTDASMGTAVAGDYGPLAAHMRLGATGDVSLTLGLRHAGNALDNSRFTIRDFGDC